MYHDFLGREIEDLEGENMRADLAEERRARRYTLTEAWARNQGYFDVADLLAHWPYTGAIAERFMHVVVQCVNCGRETVDTYRRQNPDFLAFHKYCHWCGHDLAATEVIPFVFFPRWRTLSFNTAGHCWQCGVAIGPRQRSPFVFQCGLTAYLCHRHRIAYQRHYARMDAREERKQQQAASELARQWYAWPEGDSFTLAAGQEEAYWRFVSENGGDETGVSAALATSAEIETNKLYNWMI